MKIHYFYSFLYLILINIRGILSQKAPIFEKPKESDILLNRGFIPSYNDTKIYLKDNKSQQVQQKPKSELPQYWNWNNINETNFLTLVQNQHQPQYCGSSWAFAVTSSIADRIKIVRKAQWPDFYLSPQVLLSCDIDNFGCQGGDDLMAYVYIMKNQIQENTCSVYQGKGYDQGIECTDKLKCSYCIHQDCEPVYKKQWDFTIKGIGRVKGEQEMMNEIHQRGPISCAIANTLELEKYQKGIFVDKTGTKDLNHVVSIVGWGEEKGIPYWYVRNSWGSYWGEDGFFRIIRGENNLGIEERCHFGIPEDTWSERLALIQDTKKTTKKQNQDAQKEYNIFKKFLNQEQKKIEKEKEESKIYNYGYIPEYDQNNRESIKSPLPQDYIKTSDLPEYWDWRNVDGKNYMSWNINQLIPYYCGSCWAQGASVVISDRLNIMQQNKFPQRAAAPQVLVNCRWGGSCEGGGSGRSYTYIEKFGLPEMTCKPYEGLNPNNFDCTDYQRCGHCLPTKFGVDYCFPVKQFRKYTLYKVSEHAGIPQFDFEAMKKEIYARGPIACGMTGTEKFHNYTSGIFREETSKKYTTHVINILGWGQQDGEEYWIGKNSFGTYWGEAGYFRIAMSKKYGLNIGKSCGWAVPYLVNPEESNSPNDEKLFEKDNIEI